MDLTRRSVLRSATSVLCAGPLLSGHELPQDRATRTRIRATLFIPDPLPPLRPARHGNFTPEPGVRGERISFGTQFGLRVPSILYLPEKRSGKIPAVIIVNGHGGDKYSWYAFYAGVLYARAGAAVLTYDQIGEGERNLEHKSGTRAHDRMVEPEEQMGRRMNGLMVTDLMQAVSYLKQHPAVDAGRIAAIGHSMGSFVLVIGGAVDSRIHFCMLTGGGNLDGPGEYWDRSKKMCQSTAYQALMFLGDRPAVIYALHAGRGPTLILNGLEDDMVAIPKDADAFFRDLRARTARLRGSEENLFEYHLEPGTAHRPYGLTRRAALWLEQQLDFPRWTSADIEKMPETHAGEWARRNGVFMERSDERGHAGIRALGSDVPGLSREQLSILPMEQWEARKREFILESWIERARGGTTGR